MNHPYRRRYLRVRLDPATTKLSERVANLKGLEGERKEDRHRGEATSSNHENPVKYELHETAKPIIVKRKRRWSVLERPDSSNEAT
jgi:hypothetical protein